MNTLQKFEARELKKLQDSKTVPDFHPGDTVKVNVRVKEGTRERIQAYEGVCIARTGSGLNESFTVRKISLGEGVERVFPLWSSRVDSIELVRRGSVRRAKLYYLRDRRGKSARISERVTGHGLEKKEDIAEADQLSKTAKTKAKKEAKAAQKAENRAQIEAANAAKQKAKEEEAKAAAAEAQAAEASAPEAETPATEE